MEDLVPELLDKLKKDFEKRCREDVTLKNLSKKIAQGADYTTAHKYAVRIGELQQDSYLNVLRTTQMPNGRMYYNIAERIINGTLPEDFDMIADACFSVQTLLNKGAGIVLKARLPELNQDRIDGIINRLADAENFEDVQWLTGEPITNFCQSVVDDAVKTNMDFHRKAGLDPKITRKVANNCCAWCRELEGTYSYPDDAPEDIFRRHERCRCQTIYDPKDGTSRQDVWTKKAV